MRVFAYLFVGGLVTLGGGAFNVVARQSMPGFGRIVISVVIALLGLSLIDRATYHMMPIEKPDFVYDRGDSDPDTAYVFADGFVAHPELRLGALNPAIFKGRSVLFVNPKGNRYDLESVVRATVEELTSLGVKKIIPVGISLGAKVAYRLAQEWGRQAGKEIDRVVFIDPLYDRHSVGNPLAPVIGNRLVKPGSLMNWAFSGLLTRAIVGTTNPHQRYGRTVQFTRIADEARESNGPAVDGLLPFGTTVTILYSESDTVLRGEPWLVWRNELRERGHLADGFVVPGTTHASLDVHPHQWEKVLANAL